MTEPSEHVAEYRKVRRGNFALRLALAVGLTMLIGVLGSTLYVVILMRSQQVTNTSTYNNTALSVTEVKALSAAFLDCVRPKGNCYQRSQANQRSVLDQAGRIFAYGLACSQHQTLRNNVPGLIACIEDLQRNGK